MPGIFISYRRADSPDATGRIYDRLVAEFGRAQVFKDIDSIPLGRDFRSHLNEMVGDCAAVLAIIGPHWADAHDDAGKRRLEDADDFVRIELEAALARNIPVVPVLVGHALMPGATQLPSSLAHLAFRQSIEVRPDPDFHHDTTRLLAALRRILDPNAPAVDPADATNLRATGAAQIESRLRRRSKWLTAIAAMAMLGVVAMGVPALRHLRESPPPEMRLDIPTEGSNVASHFALSPDGRQMVFEAPGASGSRLWLRSFGVRTAQPLAGTEGGQFPFWSPDGRSIGFSANNSLKRLDLGGGASRTLVQDMSAYGGTWNADGVILFGSNSGAGLMRVSATGGVGLAVTTAEPQQSGHRWPEFLPDGRHFLYLVVGAPDTAGIYLGTLDGGTPVRLTAAGKSGVYLPSGWLLWQNERNLVAQRLDLAKAALTGSPVTLADDVGLTPTWGAVSVASTGMMAYRPAADAQSQLVWFDRTGAVRGGLGGEEGGSFLAPRVSPDGRRVVASREGDLWLLDGARMTRFTFDAGRGNESPLWSPDGARIAWVNSAGIHHRLASGAGATELLASVQDSRVLSSWSADGRLLLYDYDTVGVATSRDLWVLPTEATSTPSVFLQSRFNERGAELSPDDRWVAYSSTESGRTEVYVRPFTALRPAGATPDAGTSQWQVSTAGGDDPVWRADGKELYYLDLAGALMSASFAVNGAAPEVGAPAELFRTRIYSGSAGSAFARQYDVAPDGRFLINTLLDGAGNPPITLIQNWNPEGQ